MITKVNVGLAHAYRCGQYRLLITIDINTWEARRKRGEEYPGESCIFFSRDGGRHWKELYVLNFTGNRSAKFQASVLSSARNVSNILHGAAGEVRFMKHSYELITDEKVNFTNVTRFTAQDRLRVDDMGSN